MLPATPPLAPRDMPVQNLDKAARVHFPWPSPGTCLARLVTFGGAIALTAYAGWQMYLIIGAGGITLLQWVLMSMFVPTFFWIAFTATGAIAGVLFGNRKPVSSAGILPDGRTVLLMPVYNENPVNTFASLYAMASGLIDHQAQDRFEIFVISDTQNPEVWIQEVQAFERLRAALKGNFKVWYRRRHLNRAKKAGNVHDFVTRWGARYDYMIVLDADSLLDPATLMRLGCEMDADPRCGILQTLPKLFGGTTLFARLQQFAGALYGPVVARAITAWQGDDGNYWGHNAIIRIGAFASAAGLPVMPGPRPLGGDILSHDFVEAALVRRAGWTVRMLPSLGGSWEESPPTLLDTAIRDRRWAQGNVQHLGLLKTRGLRWPSRVHMLTGAMSYLVSPLWFAMIITGLVIGAQIAGKQIEYFTDELQLFPSWPVFDSERMLFLFYLTLVVLLLPKCIGYIGGIFSPGIRKGTGFITLTLSVIVELFFSVLYAPIFMMMQTQQIWEILQGRDSGWATQQRDARGISWRTLLLRHLVHMVTGIVMTTTLLWLATPLLYWMLPTLTGLLLVLPLSALSGSTWLGKLLRFCHLLRIAEEVETPVPLQLKHAFMARFEDQILTASLPTLVQDEQARRLHFNAAGSPPQAVRGQPDLHAMAASHKIAEALCQEEARRWLTGKELLAMLENASMFENYRALPTTPTTTEPPPPVRAQAPVQSCGPEALKLTARLTT